MKKYIFLSVMVSMSFVALNGQVLSNQEMTNSIDDENAFLDASSNFNTEIMGADNNLGKGLIFPSVDLTTFQFKLDNILSQGMLPFGTYFDGMIVYNRATGPSKAGNVSTNPRNPVKVTMVKPGFYYFSNPNGYMNQNVTSGEWLPLSSGGGGGAQDEWIYCPPFMVDWASGVNGKTVDLHAKYTDGASGYTTSVGTKTTTSVTVVPNLVASPTGFEYLVRYSGSSISNISISASGIMTYNCTTTPPTCADFVSVILIRK